MLKSSNRSQRTKGLRTKRVFQAFLLIAICVWLLYEVKHSYDVKRGGAEGSDEASEAAMLRGIEAVRLGRKNLDPRESSTLRMQKQELADEEMVKQDESEAEDSEQSAEDLIDEDDREKENEIEDSGNVNLEDQVDDEVERNSPNS